MTHVREHRSILAAAEKRLLIFIAERLPRGINSDHLTSLALAAMGLAGARVRGRALGPPRALARGRCACAELVRRQPGRDARPRPTRRTASIRLLRRSRPRHRRRDAAVRRPCVLTVHHAQHRAHAPHRVSPRRGRSVPGHRGSGRVQNVGRWDRTYGTTHHPRGRRDGAATRSARVDWDAYGPAVRPGGALAAAGLLAVFVVSVLRNASALAVAEPR